MAAKKPTEKPSDDTEISEAEKPVNTRGPSEKEPADVRKLRGELAAALARVEELEASAGAPKKKGPAPLPAKYKGTKRYRSSKDVYRKGLIPAGEIFAATDCVPGKDWVEVGNDGKPVVQDE